MNFYQLLKLGQECENEAIKRIIKFNGSKLELRQDANNYKKMHHDILMNDGLKYEVKLDIASEKTGNCFIEFIDGSKKISGIALSDANFYIIHTHQLFLLIPIEKLKELTINKPIRGPKDGTKGYIINWEIIRDNSIII